MYLSYFRLNGLAIIRDRGKSIVLNKPDSFVQTPAGETKVRFVYPSRTMSKMEARSRLEEIHSNYPSVSVDIKHSFGDQYVLHVLADTKRALSPLRRYGYFGTVSLDKVVNWMLGMPFAHVEYEQRADGRDRILFTGRHAVDEVLNEVAYALDIESEQFETYKLDWLEEVPLEVKQSFAQKMRLSPSIALDDAIRTYWHGGDSVPTAVTMSSTNAMPTIAWPYRDGSATVNGLKIALAQTETTKDLISEMQAFEEKIDAGVIVGSNIGAYDLQELKKHGYKPGKDRSVPVQRSAGTGIFKPTFAKGYFTLDLASLSSLYLHQTTSNKLFEVMSHLLDKPVEKSIDYETLDSLQLSLRMGITEAEQPFLEYIAGDGEMPLEAAKMVWQPVVRIAQTFGADPTAVSFTSPRELANDLWARKRFSDLGIVSMGIRFADKEQYAKFSPAKQFLENLLENKQGSFFGVQPTIKKAKTLQSGRGYVENVRLVQLTPHFASMQPLIDVHPDLLELQEAMRNEHNPAVRQIYSTALEAALAQPFWNLGRLKDGSWEARYGNHFRVRASAVQDNIDKVTNELHHKLAQIGVLNYSDHYAVFWHPNEHYLDSHIHEMVDGRLILPLSKGNALSGTQGRFLFQSESGVLTSQGWDFTGRKGNRSEFLKYFTTELEIALMKKDGAEAMDKVYKILRGLVEGDYDELLHYEDTVHRNPWEYSDMGLHQKRIQRIIEQDAPIGSTIQTQIPNLEQHISDILGISGPKQRSLAGTPWGDMILSRWPNINKNAGYVDALASGRQFRLL